MSNLACVLWWLIPGVFLGWLASWLFDMAFRRNGTAFVETAKADLAKLNAKNQALETELGATKARAASAASEQARLNSELSVIRTAQDEATSKLGLLQTDLEGRTANLGRYADEVAALRTQLQAAKGVHDASERAFAALRAEGEQSKAALTAMRADLEAARMANINLNSELDASKRGMLSLRSEAEAAKTGGAAELAQLRANYDAAQKAVAAATADVAALRGEIVTAKAAQESIQSSFASTSTQFDGAKGTIAKLQAELDAARGDAAKMQVDLNVARAESAKLQVDLGSARADGTKSLGLLQTDLSGQKDALAAALASAERLKLELADAKQKVEHLNELKSELAALTNQYQTSQSLTTRLKADMEAGELNVGKLRMELSSAQSKSADHEKLIALLREEIAGKQRSHEAMSGRVSDIELAQQLEHERRTAMTRYGFVSRTRDRDDLTLIEGIGPKIEEVLLQARVDSHSKLAMSSVEDIERILERAGPQFKIANPGTWPRQAAMIVRGDFAELRRWQDELIAGVEMPKDNV